MDNLFRSYLAENCKIGTYLGVRFSNQTISALVKFQKDNDIQNHLKVSDIHSTLIYSKGANAPDDFKPIGEYDTPMIGTTLNFDLWGDDKKTLVLLYDCQTLKNRFEFLMKTHNFKWDFPSFQPHITFSYDVGDMTQNDMHKLVIPDELGTIAIVSEYMEDLHDER